MKPLLTRPVHAIAAVARPLCIAALCLACATAPHTVRGGPVAASASDPAPSEFMMDADDMLAQGDLYRTDGKIQAAAGAYERAKRLYLSLGASHPGWEVATIRNRMAYCDAQIAEAASAPPDAVEAPAADTPASAEAPPPPPIPSAASPDAEQAGSPAPQAAAAAEPAPVPAAAPAIGKKPAVKKAPSPPPSRANSLFSWMRRSRPDAAQPQTNQPAAKPPSPPAKPATPPAATAKSAAPATDSVEQSPMPVVAAEPPSPAPAAREAAAPEPSSLTNASPAAAAGTETSGVVADDFDPIRRLLAAGEAATARAMILNALVDRPNEVALKLMLSASYCESREYDKAMTLLRQMLLEDPSNAIGHVLLGTAYLGMGNVGVARDQMVLALDLDPTLSEAHYNLARLWIAVEPPDRTSARDHYQKAVLLGAERDPDLEKALQ